MTRKWSWYPASPFKARNTQNEDYTFNKLVVFAALLVGGAGAAIFAELLIRPYPLLFVLFALWVSSASYLATFVHDAGRLRY